MTMLDCCTSDAPKRNGSYDLAQGKAPPGDGPRIIQEALRDMGAPVQAAAAQKR